EEYTTAVSQAVHQALVTQASVPTDDLFQVIHQLGELELIANPTYGGVKRSKDLIIVEITLNAGRTIEVKKNLYADIAARLERAIGLRPDDVLVSLVEVTKENWSFGGGRMTYG
ncbi:MAG: tautomerase family protein, partial [Acidobacteriota bacterium]